MEEERIPGIGHDGYIIAPYPVLRRFALDSGYLGRRRNTMHGLLEFDVTEARRLIQAHKARTGESISFTAFLIYCLARAIEAHRETHAYLDWRNRLVIYDDVNITTMIEIGSEQGKVALPRMIYAANRKSVAEIQTDIRSAQKKPMNTREMRFIRLFLRLPGFIRHLGEGAMMRNPRIFREYASPVLVSSVGMFIKGGGWGIPLGNFSLSIFVGGMAEKPGVIEGRIEIREYLCLTLSFDRDIIDGAPAARFTQQFREFVEMACGLESYKLK